LKKNKSKW